MNEGFVVFRKLLRSCSPFLRLGFDRRRWRFVIEQRNFKGAWEPFFLIQTEEKEFRYPDFSDIERIREWDSKQFSHFGRSANLAKSTFLGVLEGQQERERLESFKMIHDMVETDAWERAVWYYRKHGWKETARSPEGFRRQMERTKTLYERTGVGPLF